MAKTGMIRRRTQVERSEEAERRLLDAAHRLIGEKGAARMTLGEVGIAAGYSRGLPTHHFGTKSALLQALAAQIAGLALQDMAAGGQAPDGLAFILQLAKDYVVSRHPVEMRTLHVMQAEGIMAETDIKEQVVAFNRATIHELERNLRLALERGDIGTGLDPKTYAILIIGLLRGISLQWMIDPEEVSAEMLQANIVDAVRNLLGVTDEVA